MNDNAVGGATDTATDTRSSTRGDHPRARWWRRGKRAAAVGAAVVAALIAARVVPHAPLASRVPVSTAVMARDGTLLRLGLASDGQYRLWTSLDDISPLLVEATLLYEDRHFAWHPGVNPAAIARAAFATYVAGDRRIGGSTITMQLARRLGSSPSNTAGGKVAQILRALELEARYSKREILEAYLNLAPYGGNIEGAGAASTIYFRKPAAKLTLAEALTLAVIPQSPAQRAQPAHGGSSSNVERLDRARAALLASWMARAPGRGRTDGEPPVRAWPRLVRGSEAAPTTTPPTLAVSLRLSSLPRSPTSASPPPRQPVLPGSLPASMTPPTSSLPDSLPSSLPFWAPHFVNRVLDEPPAAASSSTSSTTGTVVTTLDLHLQRLVERHLQNYVAREAHRGITNAAALLVDQRTVAVRALVGSASFFDESIAGQVNGTSAKRSPGSTLKPFAYGLAIDQGIIHPATMLRDVPTAFAAYSPENFDGQFAGPLSAKDALIRSRNVPALTIASRLARPSLYDLLVTAGVDLPFPESHYGLGLVLGTGEVTMEDLVRLYAALGNGGVVRPLVWRAEDERRASDTRGPSPPAPTRLLTKGPWQGPLNPPRDGARGPSPPAPTRLLSEESAFLVLDMLADNPRPSSRLPAATSSSRPLTVSWKTGTSWGFRDAWSVGLFGPYVLAVWVGDFSGAGNPAFVGAQAAAPLFFELVDSIAAREPNVADTRRTPPAGVRRVEVCALSGGLPTADCPHRRTSWFIPGRSPIEPCAIHRSVALDVSGHRTCALGPPAVRHETFEIWPSDLAKLFAAAGLPRRPLPPLAAGCGEVEPLHGSPPRITSPLAGVTYTLKARRPDDETVALQAVTDGDATEIFWFADRAFVGKTARGATLFWRPPGAGRFTVRAVDDLGRADARAVAVEVLR